MQAFTDGMSKSLTDSGEETARNTPSLFNLAINPGVAAGWIGQTESTEEQNGFALLNEMLAVPEQLSATINGNETYQQGFVNLFGSATTPSNVLDRTKKVLDAYVLSQISEDTNADLQNQFPESSYLTQQQLNGKKLFFGKARCAGCHAGSTFTDNQFHNNGFFTDQQLAKGLNGARLVKTPSLRNLGQTAPYMHDGSISSIRDVVDIYNDGGRRNANGDLVSDRIHHDILPLELTEQEKNQLVRYLESL